MAKKVDPHEVEVRRPGARPMYPWSQWMDGDWWELTQGEDYKVSTPSFRASAYQVARRRGYAVQSRQTRGGILLRFVPRDSDPA